MGKKIILVVGVVMLLAALTASAGGKQEAAAAEKQIVIYNSYNGDPEPRRVDKELVQMFEEANPQIDVVHSIVAHEDFKQAIRAYGLQEIEPVSSSTRA